MFSATIDTSYFMTIIRRYIFWIFMPAAAALFAGSLLFIAPVNIDETIYLRQLTWVWEGIIPLRDAVIVVFEPVFWIAAWPVAKLSSTSFSLVFCRAFGLVSLIASFMTIHFVQRLRDRENAWESVLFSLGTIILFPQILYKVAEFRPDALAAAATLGGSALFIMGNTNARRAGGLAAIGLALGLRMETAIILPILGLGALVLIIARRMAFYWLFLLAAPPLIFFITALPFMDLKNIDYLYEVMAFARMLPYGRGDLSNIFSIMGFVGLALIWILGLMAMITDLIWNRTIEFRVFAGVSLAFVMTSLAIHLAAGAIFPQNFWLQVIF